jgi:hypothetical protein
MSTDRGKNFYDTVLTCSDFDGHIEAEHEFVPFKKAVADVVIEVAR